MKLNTPSNVQSKSDIIRELTNAYIAVDNCIHDLDDSSFTTGHDGKWSPMLHLQHLILSSKRIPSALNMSKLKLSLMGKAKDGSRSYDDLKKSYYDILATGFNAGSEYTPEANVTWPKEELLGNWRMIQDKFEKRIEKWSEKELDTFRLPHPAMGKLTFREMLFFTIFHTHHHLQGIKYGKNIK